MRTIVLTSVLMALLACSCRGSRTEVTQQQPRVTAEMAYEGVNNYCHSEYDWTVAARDSVMMYVTMGEETEEEYQVIFRSYTGSFVYFYVAKSSGTTRMVEYVPMLNIKNDAGTIDLLDYL